MALREPLYLENIIQIKEVGPRLRVVQCHHSRNAGVEVPKKETKESKVKEDHSENRREDSISRSKRNIYEYALCNPFGFFFTGTIAGQKMDRYDLPSIHKKFTQWIRNYRRINKCEIVFLIVPECHKDGAIHLHGFIGGIPEEHLHRFKIGDRMGKHIADKVKNGETVYNWPKYAKAFGFCDLEPIKDITSAAKYIEKYITKELALAVEGQDQCYWHSRGLKKGEVIAKGYLLQEPPFDWDYKGEYALIKEFENTETMRDSLLSLLEPEARILRKYRTEKYDTE